MSVGNQNSRSCECDGYETEDELKTKADITGKTGVRWIACKFQEIYYLDEGNARSGLEHLWTQHKGKFIEYGYKTKEAVNDFLRKKLTDDSTRYKDPNGSN